MNTVILGAFFGDEAKGQCVNNICNNYLKQGYTTNQLLVVRFSGANQVGHNVKHNDITHCFRNFGSGTLQGITTYWSEFCVCDLHTYNIERVELEALGITPRIIYSPKCQITTPFDVIHQWNNTLNRNHGTVGTGFKSVLDRVKAGYSLTVTDAQNLIILREKVWSIYENYYKLATTCNLNQIDDWIQEVHKIAKTLVLRNFDDIKNYYSHIVFEGSQGILLDQTYGVMPWCTPSNTTSENVVKLLGENKFRSIYVCRPYITRHGSGPLLTTSKVIDIKDPNNPYNEYQKQFRVCEFDIELLKHSIKINKIFDKCLTNYVMFSHGEILTKELYNKVKDSIENIDIKVFSYESFLDSSGFDN